MTTSPVPRPDLDRLLEREVDDAPRRCGPRGPSPSGSSVGTRYRALAIHADTETCRQHAAMGFEDGWGAALDQLLEMVKADAAGL
jgi:hypothetical protein